MRFFDEPVRAQVGSKVRPAILHLMGNHSTGRGDPVALLEVVDAYLRLNPQDAEVSEARERLVVSGNGDGPTSSEPAG